jgi:hypothetical protein
LFLVSPYFLARKNTMSRYQLPENLSNARSTITTAADQLNAIQSIIRVAKPLQWSSVAQVALSLRFILGLRLRFFQLRKAFLAAADNVNKLVDNVKDSFAAVSGSYEIKRKSGGGFGSSWAEGERTYTATHWTANVATLEDYRSLVELVNRWENLCQAASEAYVQSKGLIGWASSSRDTDGLRAYRDIKKLLPLGGRAAYSAILVCDIGKLTRNLAHEHELFGWSDSNSNIATNLRQLIRGIRSRNIERKGKAPSFKDGCELLSRQYVGASSSAWKFGIDSDGSAIMPAVRFNQLLSPPSWHMFNRNIVERDGIIHRPTLYDWAQRLYATLLCGSVHHGATPAMLMEVYRGNGKFARRNAIAARICGVPYNNQPIGGNQVATILTSDIERIGDSQDYWAECLYADNLQAPTGRISGFNTVRSIVLFRQGWPSIYHVGKAKPSQWPNYGNPKLVVNEDDAAFNAATDPAERQAIAHRILDNASRAHFDNIRYQRESEARRLSADKATRKRLADMVRQLRHISAVTWADSYRSGNCEAGTRQFVNAIGLPLEQGSIDGRSLAFAWRKAGWLERARVENVILKLAAEQAANMEGTSAHANH